MPPRRSGRKRKGDTGTDVEASEVSEVSDGQTPPPKKPRNLGRARPKTKMALELSESSTAQQKTQDSGAEDTEIEELPQTKVREGPGRPVERDQYLKHVSYIGMYHAAGIGPPLPGHPDPRMLRPRQPRWKNDKDEPITKFEDAPKGWNANEPDLDPDDIDAQIDRCFERIEDGIMPQFFEARLDKFLGFREARKKAMAAGPKGCDFETAQRWKSLNMIKDHLETTGDPDEQLPNLRGILKAYELGKVKCSTGMVTYWSDGVQLNEPTQFNQELHEKMLKENDTTKSFWVEGLLQGTSKMGLMATFPPWNAVHATRMNVTCSLDGGSAVADEDFKFLEIPVLHDTGADQFGISTDKLEALQNLGTLKPTVLGYTVIEGVNAISCNKVIEVDLTVEHPLIIGQYLCTWLRLPAIVIESPKNAISDLTCLSGPFPRWIFYTATCPDGTGTFFMCDYKDELLQWVPDLPPGHYVGTPPVNMTLYPPSPGGGPPRHIKLGGKRARLPIPSPIKKPLDGQVKEKENKKENEKEKGKGKGKAKAKAKGKTTSS